MVICESSDDCSYDDQHQHQQPLRTRVNERCKDEDSCLPQDGSVELAENGVNDEVVPHRPFAANSRSLTKTYGPPTADEVPPQALKSAAVDRCRFVCYVMAKTMPEIRMNQCITKYCTAVEGQARLPSLEKRWGNRVGRWSKRWGNRVCLEAHCRPFENNVRAFLACGQSQCHGK